MKFDLDQIELSEIGSRIIKSNEQPYVGPLVASWDLALEPKAGHLDRRIVVDTPLKKAGVYLLSARVADGNLSRIVVGVADTVIVKKPTPGGQYFFVADAISGQPVPNANLEFFGYDVDSAGPNGEITRIETREFTRTTGPDGQLILDDKVLDPHFNWLTIARTTTGRLAFVGFKNIWYPPHSVSDRHRLKTFIITDRPLYRPGQPVKFKCWVRRSSYDGPIDQAAAHRSFRVKINNPKDETVFESDYTSDDSGGFHGEYTPSKEARLGTYTLSIEGGEKSEERDKAEFRVEEYRKPEFAVSIETPPAPVRLGEEFTATIRASYYFGAPVRQAKVKLSVVRTRYSQAWYPRGRWDWLYGPGYGSFARHYAWPPGRRFWESNAPRRPTIGLSEDEMVKLERLAAALHQGEGEWDEPIKWDEGDGLQDERVELIKQDEVPIGTDGTVKITIETARALEEFAGVDHRYVIAAEVVDGSRRTIVGTGTVLVAARPFEAFAWLDRGYYRPGEEIVARLETRALDQKPVSAKGKATLFRISYQDEKPVEKAVESWNLATDRAGESELRLKAAEPGQYRLAFTLDDGQKRSVEHACVFLVAGEGFDGNGLHFDNLELIPDKRAYAPGDKVRLLVNANHPGATVLLFVRAANGKVGPAQMLRLDGKSTSFEIEIVEERRAQPLHRGIDDR